MENLISELEQLHEESKYNRSALTIFISALNSNCSIPNPDILAEALFSLQNAVDANLEKIEAALAELRNLYGLSLSREP